MMGWLRDLWDGFKSLISEIFGGSSSSGNSVDSKAEIHKRFVRFSKQLSGDAKKQEDESMAEVRGAFEGIFEKYRKDYPDVLSAIIDKQKKAEISIKGTIIGYVEKNATENNDDILRIFQIEDETERKKQGQQKMNQILGAAVDEFNQKLKSVTDELYKELHKRFTSTLHSKEKELKKQDEELETLGKEINDWEQNVAQLEISSIFLSDSQACIDMILEGDAL